MTTKYIREARKDYQHLEYLMSKCRNHENHLHRFFSSLFVAENGCWIWTKHKTEKGYGDFKYAEKSWRANRFSYEIFNGSLGNLDCLHKCHNPSCVNPDHLYAGTNKQNLQDRYDMGRTAKLKPEQVAENPSMYRRQIAAKFGVCRQNIDRILNNQQWKEKEEHEVYS